MPQKPTDLHDSGALPPLPEPTIEDIVTKAENIISQRTGPTKLAWLGQELNRTLETSIRKTLGQRALGDVLLERFGEKYEVQGSGPYREIGLKGSWQHAQKTLHFANDFWANFERPLSEGLRRWLPAGELSAIDSPTQPLGITTTEIESHFIVDGAVERGNRGKFIRHNILTWAKAHGLDLECFRKKVAPVAELADTQYDGPEPSAVGISAIKAIMNAVPEDERARYSINLDLLARMLNIR